MKKFIPLFLLLCLSLTACVGGSTAESTEFSTDIVTTLVEQGAFSEDLETLEPLIAFSLFRLGDYEITQENLVDCVVLRSSGATAEEVAMLVLDSQESAAAAMTAMESYWQSQIAANQDYRPDDIPKLESATLIQQGATVLFVVANDTSVVDSVI